MSGKEVPLMHQSALLFSVTNVLYINKFIFVNIGCSGKDQYLSSDSLSGLGTVNNYKSLV